MQSHAHHGSCPSCDYSWRQFAGNACPECGIPVTDAWKRHHDLQRKRLVRFFGVTVVLLATTVIAGLVMSHAWPDQWPVDDGSYGAHFPTQRATTWPFGVLVRVFPVTALLVGACAALIAAGSLWKRAWPLAWLGAAIPALLWLSLVVWMCASDPFD